MFSTSSSLIEYCETNNKRIYELVLEEECENKHTTEEEVLKNLKEILSVLNSSANAAVNEKTTTPLGMIDGFANMMNIYSENENTITGQIICKTMAMAFSTLEVSSSMGKIVASPTAGSSGILPAVLMSIKLKENIDDEKLINGMLTAVGIGQIIGKHANFSGAEGGCQAECGSAAAMAAAALVEIKGGTAEQCLHAASFSLVHVLGLVCDPIAGLVEYPCTFRNASGAINAMISADMALAGIKSIVPFDEVAKTMGDVGKTLPFSLRESGIGGLAGTPTGVNIRNQFYSKK